MISDIPDTVRTALTRLIKNDFSAYLVGGSIRELLSGRQPVDYDLATSARPETICKIFRDYRLIQTGKQHGTVTVLINHRPIEITTFRIDGTYSDRRRPDAVIFANSIESDLARRDFTINAMAWSPPLKNLQAPILAKDIFDPFDGRSDLKRKLIRSVGDPDLRFQEDVLRVLRGLRLAAELSFTIEIKTSEAIHRHRAYLSDLPGERVFSELRRMLSGRSVGHVLTHFWDVMSVVIPEIDPTRKTQFNQPILESAQANTVRVVSACPPSFHLRLAALLHDVAHTENNHIESAIDATDFSLSLQSAQIAASALNRLRCDRKTQTRVVAIIAGQHTIPEISAHAVKHWLRQIGLDLAIDILSLNRAFGLASQSQSKLKQIDEIERIVQLIQSDNQCYHLKNLAIDGYDLIQLGMKPGKAIGLLLNILLTGVINGQIDNQKSTLLEAAKEYLSDGVIPGHDQLSD